MYFLVFLEHFVLKICGIHFGYIYIRFCKENENRTKFLKSDPRGKKLLLLGSRKISANPFFGALAHKQKQHRRGSS